MKKKKILLIFLIINLCISCKQTQNLSITEIINVFRYNITEGTIIPVESNEDIWSADSFIVSQNTICILTYSGTEGWTLNETQQLGIECNIKNISEEIEGKIFYGTITNNGLQNEAYPISDEHFNILFDLNMEGPYYIYFMNISSTDIKIENLKMWIQNDGQTNKYIF